MERDIRNEVCYKECVNVIEWFDHNRDYMQTALVATLVELEGDDVEYVTKVCSALCDDYVLNRIIMKAYDQYLIFISHRKLLRESD